MHRRHLIEEVRLHQLQTRLEELGAYQHRHRAADDSHQQGEEQVERTDILVVGGEQPARDAAVRAVVVICTHGLILRMRAAPY